MTGGEGQVSGEEIIVVPDAQALAREAARRFAGLAREAAERRGRFAALSGGKTPGALYRRLAEEPYRSRIPWTQCTSSGPTSDRSRRTIRPATTG